MSAIIVSLSTSGACRWPNAVGSPSERGMTGLPGMGSRFCDVIFSIIFRIGLDVRCALMDMGTCQILARLGSNVPGVTTSVMSDSAPYVESASHAEEGRACAFDDDDDGTDGNWMWPKLKFSLPG